MDKGALGNGLGEARDHLGTMGIVQSVEEIVLPIFGIGGAENGASHSLDEINVALAIFTPVVVVFVKGMWNAWKDDGRISRREFVGVVEGTVEEAIEQFEGDRVDKQPPYDENGEPIL